MVAEVALARAGTRRIWIAGSTVAMAPASAGPPRRAVRVDTSNSPLRPRNRTGSGDMPGTMDWMAGSNRARRAASAIVVANSSGRLSASSAQAASGSSTTAARRDSSSTSSRRGGSTSAKMPPSSTTTSTAAWPAAGSRAAFAPTMPMASQTMAMRWTSSPRQVLDMARNRRRPAVSRRTVRNGWVTPRPAGA